MFALYWAKISGECLQDHWSSGLHMQKTAYLMTRINCGLAHNCNTVMVISFRTGRSGQTVQTQIRLLLEEQSDQGLHTTLFAIPLASFDKIP